MEGSIGKSGKVLSWNKHTQLSTSRGDGIAFYSRQCIRAVVLTVLKNWEMVSRHVFHVLIGFIN